MFTGIISDIGQVGSIEDRADPRFTILTAYDPATIAIGASIACDGCCLTVVETGPHDKATGYFVVDVSHETLSKTTLGTWQTGHNINLERALRAGDELGGHVVSGHVDGLGSITSIANDGLSKRFQFTVADELARYIAAKGSVTLNGTSLTVNEVDGNVFGVNIIPHTQQVTTWGRAAIGEAVNVEIDMLARYVARLREFE